MLRGSCFAHTDWAYKQGNLSALLNRVEPSCLRPVYKLPLPSAPTPSFPTTFFILVIRSGYITMHAFTLLPILMLLACSQQGRSRGDDWGTVMRTMHGATVTSMPAPSQPGVHEESPGRPGSVLAATLRDIQDCTDRHGKALWRPGSKESGLPIIKKPDVVSTDPMPDNWTYRARLAVMSAWSVVSGLLYADLLCLPSAESTHPFAIICRQRNRGHVHLRKYRKERSGNVLHL